MQNIHATRDNHYTPSCVLFRFCNGMSGENEQQEVEDDAKGMQRTSTARIYGPYG